MHGHGFVVVPKPQVEALEKRLRAEFPHGSHMTDVRGGVSRKVKRLKRMAALLERYPRVLCGAELQVNPGHLRQIVAQNILNCDTEQRRQFRQEFRKARSRGENVVDDLLDSVRLSSFLSGVLRFSIVSALKGVPSGKSWLFEINIATSGGIDAFQRRVASLQNVHLDHLHKEGGEFLRRAGCPPASVRLVPTIVPADSSPVLWLADAFGFVGRSVASQLAQSQDSMPAPYLAVRAVLERSAYGVIPGILVADGERALRPAVSWREVPRGHSSARASGV